MKKRYIDWKDIASSYYPKSLSLAVLMVLFTFLVSPKMNIKPYKHKEIKVQVIDIPPEIKEIVKPPEERPAPQIKQVIITDEAGEDDEDTEIVETIPNTNLDVTKVNEAPEVKLPPKYLIAEVQPYAIKRVAPKYPETAKKLHIEGTVILMAVIDEKGNVIKVEVKKSVYQSLDEAAIKALKQWKFEPAKTNGKPISVWVTIPIEFKLN